MTALLDSLAAWWRYRTIPALDVEIAAAGDTAWLLIRTGRRGPKRAVVQVRMDRDELGLLGEMIREMEAGPCQIPPTTSEEE